MSNVWTADLERAAISLRDKGYSAAQIAHQLGHGISRNAVIGKLIRLGHRLTRDAKPTLPPPAITNVPSIPVAPPKPKPKRTLVIPTEAPQAVGPLNTFPDHDRGACRYPHGDPGESDWHICGQRAKDGSSYCEFHHARCYVPFQNGAKISDQDKVAIAKAARMSGMARAFG